MDKEGSQEASVPVTLARVDEKITNIVRMIPDHERRLRRLEWIAAGVVSAVGVIVQHVYGR